MEFCFQITPLAFYIASMSVRIQTDGPLADQGSNLSNRNVFRFPAPKELMEFTGERFTTAVDGEIRHEHFHRYLFALQFCEDKSVLDVASGEGYGSALLGAVASEVIGVDKSADAVRHANTNYYDRNISFRVGRAENLPIADQSIDVVVSFETLEHLQEHDAFLSEIKRVLRPAGLLVISSPDRDVYSGESQIRNPHHEKELTRAEFQELLQRYFEHTKFLAQKSLMGSVIAVDQGAPPDASSQGFRRLYETFFERQSGLCSPMYHIGVASQSVLQPIATGTFDDRQFQLGLYAELQRRHEEILRGEAHAAALREEMAKSVAEANERSAKSLVELGAEAEAVRQKLEQSCGELARLETQLAESRDQCARVGTQLAERIERTRMLVAERDERIQALIAERRSLNDLVKAAGDRLEKVTERSSARQAQLATELTAQSNLADRLSKHNEEQAALIAAGLRQNSELDAQLVAARESLSWKITAPLRALVDGWMAFVSVLYKTPVFRWTGKPLAKIISFAPIPAGRWLLPHNPLFDADFYRDQYPDSANSRDPWAHYLAFGADEGRDPHPLFDSSFYRTSYPDVAARGLNPLVHYLHYGASEGRNPHSGFDTAFYLAAYPDIQGKINPLLHYSRYGRFEGRKSSASSGPLAKPSLVAKVQAEDNALEPTSALAVPEKQPGPQICVIVPTYNTPKKYLRLALESVRKQRYPNWRLCVYDDGSTNPETIAALKEYVDLDPRISIQFGTSNRGIARASNAALAMAHGEYVAMLDHDDELTPDALQEVAGLLIGDWTIDAVYTDQRYIGADGELQEPFYKTDWSPEFFRGVMFVGHLLVVRLELARKLGGFNPGFDRVQDFEFMLRLSEATKRIRHLPKVLYYWRRIPGSVAFGGDEKGKIEEIQAAAVNGQLSRLGIPAVAAPHPHLAHRLVIGPLKKKSFPTINVIVSDTASGRWPGACLRSVVERSTYPNLTFTVSSSMSLTEGLGDSRIRVCSDDGRCNVPSGYDYTVWIDADLEVMTADWIEHLLFYCEQAEIACAAPLITQSDGAVWNAGLVLGMDRAVGYPMRGLHQDSDGYAGSLSCAREVSAVSGECMMISSASLSEVGGLVKFYETQLFQGADFALRAFTMKRRNIVTPRARLRKTGRIEQAPAGWNLDLALFCDRWNPLAKGGDPYYNPNFELTSPGYDLPRAAAAQAS